MSKKDIVQSTCVQSTCCECGEYTLCNQKTKLCLNCDKMFKQNNKKIGRFKNEFLYMVKGEIDKEISSLESSYKKQFTRNQVIKFYQEFYKKIAWNLELEEKYVKK